MKLGIMQPYFFPYLGYFDLIFQTDNWIVFDSAQYIRHGWVNRNRILHPTKGWQYITVPIKKTSQTTSIYDIQISNNTDWKSRILGQLNHYKKWAPYYKNTIQLLNECFDSDEENLCNLNIKILEHICNYLQISFNYQVYSKMNLNLQVENDPGGWALEISKALSAKEYLNPPGGENLFNPTKFKSNGIKLSIQNPVNFNYSTGNFDFVPNLSIIDVLMWNNPESVISYLDKSVNVLG